MAALAGGRYARVIDLTADREQFERRWPSRMRLDLAHVAALQASGTTDEAVAAMREALDAYLEADITDALGRNAALGPITDAWIAIRAERARKAMRPVRGLFVLGVFVTIIGGLVSLAGNSYALECHQAGGTGTADCVITRSWLGTAGSRRSVVGVREAFAYRPDTQTSGVRMALRSASGEVDVHPNALTSDDERAEAFNRFLADPAADSHSDRWSFDLLALAGVAGALAGLVFVVLALFKWLGVRRRARLPQS